MVTTHEQLEQRVKELELELMERKQLEDVHRITLENILDPVFITDSTGKFTFISSNVHHILGYTVEGLQLMGNISKVLGKAIFEPEELENTGEIRNIEGVIVDKFNRQRIFLITVKRVNIKGGTNLYACREITELKRIEHGRRESEEKFAAAFHASPNLIAITRITDGTILEVNEGYSRLLGYSRAESIGKTTDSLSIWGNPSDRATFVSRLEKFGEITDFETTLRHKDGTLITVIDSARTIQFQGETCTLSVVHDITERKRAEEALLVNEERYRLAQAVGHVGSWEYNLQTTRFWGSDEAKRIYGFDPEQLDFSTDEVENCILERERVHQALVDLIETGKPYNLEFEIHPKNSSESRIIMSVAELQRDGHGDPLKVVGVIQDITGRKRAEEKLRESEMRFRTIFEAAGNVSLIMAIPANERDPNPRVSEFSPGAEKIFGYKREEMIDKPLSILHLPKDAAMFPEMQKKMRDGKVGFSGEITLVRKSGEKFPALLTTHPLFDEKGVMYAALGVSLDMSEQKKLEIQLQQAQKMEAIGTLAGGIAHDFNNLLGVIMGYIELSQNFLQPKSEIYTNLSNALEACIRAKELTNQFITFSKGGHPLKKTGSIVKLIHDSSNLILAGSNVKCEFCISEDLRLADFDERQIKQVFNQLIINAREAMLDGGTINVTAENESVGDESPLALKAGKYVRISIEDHGVGIPKENHEKIFDPYFSTKQMGVKKGMGLGLATVYSIIKKHQGAIKVASEIGKGATFSIYLPASEKEIVEEIPTKEKPFPLEKGKVLVMDDEQMLRHVAKIRLNNMGYEVEVARDGVEAIEMYKKAKESGKPFDIVILDLTVKGGMGGKEAIQKLIEIDPGVKAIVSSGYSNDAIMTDYRRYGFSFAMPKPYSLAELRAALSNVMVAETKDH